MIVIKMGDTIIYFLRVYNLLMIRYFYSRKYSVSELRVATADCNNFRARVRICEELFKIKSSLSFKDMFSTIY